MEGYDEELAKRFAEFIDSEEFRSWSFKDLVNKLKKEI